MAGVIGRPTTLIPLPTTEQGEFRIPIKTLREVPYHVLAEAEKALMDHLHASPGIVLSYWETPTERVYQWGPA